MSSKTTILLFVFFILNNSYLSGQNSGNHFELDTIVHYEVNSLFDINGEIVGKVNFSKNKSIVQIKNRNPFELEKFGEIEINIEKEVVIVIIRSSNPKIETIYFYNLDGEKIAKVEGTKPSIFGFGYALSKTGDFYFAGNMKSSINDEVVLRKFNKHGKIEWEKSLTEFMIKDLSVSDSGDKIVLTLGYHKSIKETNTVVYIFNSNGDELLKKSYFEAYNTALINDSCILICGLTNKILLIIFKSETEINFLTLELPFKNENLIVPVNYNKNKNEIIFWQIVKNEPHNLIKLNHQTDKVEIMNLEEIGFVYEPEYRIDKYFFDKNQSLLKLVTNKKGIFNVRIN